LRFTTFNKDRSFIVATQYKARAFVMKNILILLLVMFAGIAVWESSGYAGELSFIVPANAPLAASEPVVAEPQRPLLPIHAMLRFSVYIGQSGIKVGESVHTLDIINGHYTLKADAHTTGLIDVFKTYHIEQTSTGTATQQILKPETFTEIITQNNVKETNRGDFDWANHKIHFSNGIEAPLPARALDILSTLYQFPPMRKDDEVMTINIATGKDIETFRFQVDFEKSLKTAMGILETVHFRRLHNANEEGLEIWFAQAFRLLPVKVRHLDSDEKIDGEAIITEIRVSDVPLLKEEPIVVTQ
jgi:hypothetical protein